MLVAPIREVYEIVEWEGFEPGIDIYPDWVLNLIEAGHIFMLWGQGSDAMLSTPGIVPPIMLPLRLGDFILRTSEGRIATMLRDDFIENYQIVDDGGVLELEDTFYNVLFAE